MARLEDIHAGDKVQITKSAIDVTNGVKAGSRYVEGTSEWGYVQGVYSNWVAAYGSNKGKGVNKVRILGTDKSTVVWQVEPEHVSDNIIHMGDCAPKPAVVEQPVPPVEVPLAPLPSLPEPPPSLSSTIPASSRVRGTIPRDAFVTTPQSDTWRPVSGDTSQSYPTQGVQNGDLSLKVNSADNPIFRGKEIGTNVMETLTTVSPVRFSAVTTQASPQGANKLKLATNVEKASSANILDGGKKKIVLNDEPSLIQNENSFPYRSAGADYSKMVPAAYDYQIRIGDSRYPDAGRLEDQLMQARAALGIPVHGRDDLAKTMRYFLYNRFKSPDINLAHNKSFTHVFFTRPDLNILEVAGRPTIAAQCKHHTEASMIWLRNPSLFKLLVDRKRSMDSNNFNMLLSNSVTSFGFDDENLTYLEAGRSWGEHAIQYGDSYSGRTAGEFSVNFTDDKEYSIINLLKLWLTYIDNVSRGAWLPSYNLFGRSNIVSKDKTGSHVYTKTLDYAASAYVFKVAEDGSDILYWTKYYGVFPINTGASALSWELGQSPGDAPKLNIRFRYSYKRDMSPVALLEFNHNANVTQFSTGGAVPYERPWSDAYNHSNRPYVGTPFIQIKIPRGTPVLEPNKVHEFSSAGSKEKAQIRLQFLPAEKLIGNADREIFRATTS